MKAGPRLLESSVQNFRSTSLMATWAFGKFLLPFASTSAQQWSQCAWVSATTSICDGSIPAAFMLASSRPVVGPNILLASPMLSPMPVSNRMSWRPVFSTSDVLLQRRRGRAPGNCWSAGPGLPSGGEEGKAGAGLAERQRAIGDDGQLVAADLEAVPGRRQVVAEGGGGLGGARGSSSGRVAAAAAEPSRARRLKGRMGFLPIRWPHGRAANQQRTTTRHSGPAFFMNIDVMRRGGLTRRRACRHLSREQEEPDAATGALGRTARPSKPAAIFPDTGTVVCLRRRSMPARGRRRIG